MLQWNWHLIAQHLLSWGVSKPGDVNCLVLNRLKAKSLNSTQEVSRCSPSFRISFHYVFEFYSDKSSMGKSLSIPHDGPLHSSPNFSKEEKSLKGLHQY